jgi:hypothetical protein
MKESASQVRVQTALNDSPGAELKQMGSKAVINGVATGAVAVFVSNSAKGAFTSDGQSHLSRRDAFKNVRLGKT